MKIVNVASINPVKVRAVRETIVHYPALRPAQVRPLRIPSKVNEQPFSMKETIQGAYNRAIGAFRNCDYSFGIESGLIKADHTATGYLTTIFCMIYDGEHKWLGMGCSFEAPSAAMDIVKKDHDIGLSTAFHQAGFTKEENIGYGKGLIHFLSNGRVNRLEQAKQAVTMALIHLENSELYTFEKEQL